MCVYKYLITYFRKPIIREHEQDIFESVGIDESLATELIVDSNGDDFKEITKKIANNPEVADKPKVEDRIKEVRRRGKNCKAAKKSREKQIKHMQNLRETHKQLSAELSELERWHRKCQVCMYNFHANSVKIFCFLRLT